MYFLFFQNNSSDISYWDNSHEMSKPISGKNKKNTVNLSSAEEAKRVSDIYFAEKNQKNNEIFLLSRALE